MFASWGIPDSPARRDHDERACLALRYVLRCDNLAAAIPGLITVGQVKKAAPAVKERRQLHVAQSACHQRLGARMSRRLPLHYERLREWERVSGGERQRGWMPLFRGG